MKTYSVTWQIDIDADTPQKAAKRALEIQRDPTSHATVFDVIEFDPQNMEEHGDSTRIDLLEESEYDTHR